MYDRAQSECRAAESNQREVEAEPQSPRVLVRQVGGSSQADQQAINPRDQTQQCQRGENSQYTQP